VYADGTAIFVIAVEVRTEPPLLEARGNVKGRCYSRAQREASTSNKTQDWKRRNGNKSTPHRLIKQRQKDQ